MTGTIFYNFLNDLRLLYTPLALLCNDKRVQWKKTMSILIINNK